MSSSGESIATPLVRGVLAAAVSLGTVLALVVVPALAAQVAGTRSDASALDAVIIALNLLILGHGGGVVLSTGSVEGSVTLTPFGLTAVLIVVSAVGMRRVGRALRLVRDDGVLRVRALRDAGGAVIAYVLVYVVGVGLLAAIGRSSDVSAVVPSAVVSAALIAVLGGLAGLLWSLRRDATSSVPGVRVLDLLPSPFDAVARSVLLAVVGLFAAGMAVSVGLLLWRLPAQSALFDELGPGVVGAVVLTLLQLALLPLLAVWALVVILGGTISVGTGTGISLGGAETGVLPALPMLAAVPEPGDAPAWALALLVLPVGVLALGAVRLVLDVRSLPLRDRVTAWVAYPVLVALAMLLIAGLSTGGIGDGRLTHLGPRMATLLAPLALMAVVTTGAVLGILATPLIPWTRRRVAAVREKVETAEQEEHSVDTTDDTADDPAADEGPGVDEVPAADEDADAEVDNDARAPGQEPEDSTPDEVRDRPDR